MSVTAQTPLNSYTGNGVTTVFAFSFLLLLADDLTVKTTTSGVVSTKVLGTEYTVSGLGVGSGGTVTFTAAPASGATVVIYRDSDIARATDYQNNGDLLAATVNLDFDRLWLVLQEIFSGGKGAPTALRVPNGETVPELAAAADRALRILSFDSAGNPMMIVGVDSSSAAALALDLANGASATKGPALIAHSYALTYPAGSAGAAFNQLGVMPGTGNGVTDMTATLLTAFNYAIPNSKTVVLSGNYIVSGSISSIGSIAAGALNIYCAGDVTITVSAGAAAFTTLLSCYTTAINSSIIWGGRLTINLNSKCSNGIYARHAGLDGGVISWGPITVLNAKENNAAVTTENQALLVYGRYTSVSMDCPIVDGVNRMRNPDGACKGISISDVVGPVSIFQPIVSRVMAGPGASQDADGISVFGYAPGAVYAQRSGSLLIENPVITDCQGRSIKTQVSESLILSPVIRRKAVVAFATADIDHQVGGTHEIIAPSFEYVKNGAVVPFAAGFYPISWQQQCTDRPSRLRIVGGTLRTESSLNYLVYLTVGASSLSGELDVDGMEFQPVGGLATSVLLRAVVETHAGQVQAATATHVRINGVRGSLSGCGLLGYTDATAANTSKLSFEITDCENTGADSANSRVFHNLSGTIINQVAGFKLRGNQGFNDYLGTWVFNYAAMKVGCSFSYDRASSTASNGPVLTGSYPQAECVGQFGVGFRSVRVMEDTGAALKIHYSINGTWRNV